MAVIKKILITGSSGMIGTRLAEVLLLKGYSVIGFDKKKNYWRPNFNKLTILGNLLNNNDIKKIPGSIDLVIHLAANARVYELVKYPDLAMENISSTFNVLDFIRKNKIKNIIFASSREVYGNRRKVFAKEQEADISFCESAYSASKTAGECLMHSFGRCYGIKYIICRFSNVYGMYDLSERLFPVAIKKMSKNEDLEVFGKDKILDFTYIDDCVDGIVRCVQNFEKANGNVFNISSGKGEKLLNVVKIIKKELQSKSKIKIKKSRTGEVVRFIANISKAKKILNYSPKYSIKAGTKLALQWYEKEYDKK